MNAEKLMLVINGRRVAIQRNYSLGQKWSEQDLVKWALLRKLRDKVEGLL